MLENGSVMLVLHPRFLGSLMLCSLSLGGSSPVEIVDNCFLNKLETFGMKILKTKKSIIKPYEGASSW